MTGDEEQTSPFKDGIGRVARIVALLDGAPMDAQAADAVLELATRYFANVWHDADQPFEVWMEMIEQACQIRQGGSR